MGLEITPAGLIYTVDVAKTHVGDDLLELVRPGEIRHSSVGMQVVEDDWSYDDNVPLRRLISGRLVEISAVSQPAYLDATVGLRSMACYLDAPIEEVMQCGGDYSRFFKRTDNIQSAPPVLVETRSEPKTPTPHERLVELMRIKAEWDRPTTDGRQALLEIYKTRMDWEARELEGQ
jgi:hypothetical protein